MTAEDEEPAPAAAAPDQEKRWINAELEGREPNRPLQVGETYTLSFDVDTESRSTAIAAHPLLDRGLFAKGEEMVDLTVQLASEDFEIFTEPQKLRLPLHGKSKNRARFDLSPKKEGSGVVNALFLKNGNFVQLMTFKLQTGRPLEEAISSSKTLGRSLDSSFDMKPRDVTLVFRKTADGFQAILSSSVYAIATLPITEPQLNQMIAQARESLQSIVDLAAGPDEKAVYQEGIDIPAKVNQEALRTVAKAGFRLFQQIFSGPASDAQSKLLGSKLRQLAQKERLKIQILSEKFLLPWGILYMSDAFDPAKVDPEMFLGLKHIIEHIPLQPEMEVLGNTIDSRPLLNVGVNVNADIDEKMGIPVIADQLQYWQGLSGRGAAKLTVRKTREEVEKALSDPACPDQVLYFYCHAVSKALSERGGPDESALVLTGDGRLTLEDLSLMGSAGGPLSGSPLVFINACESAELSPLFYDGFVPFFLSRGARGVVGTECETPALFAAAWARRFFDEFLQGKTLGKVFLDLRREFFERHNNLLGLLYALYCDGDTRIMPGIAETAGPHAGGPDA